MSTSARSGPRTVVDLPHPEIDVRKLFSLTGKTAIVTGGTGSLGTAMTAALASAGANILSIEYPDDPNRQGIVDVVTKAGRSLKRIECDLRDSKALRATFQKIWARGIRADILLNCASLHRHAEAEEFSDEDIEAVLDINIKATLISCQEFARPLLKDSRPGKIINAASILAANGGNNSTPCAASKGGVLQATKAFSTEWARRGIQVNCICPGGMSEDLAGSIIFLASAASDYVSGQTIVVDGSH